MCLIKHQSKSSHSWKDVLSLNQTTFFSTLTNHDKPIWSAVSMFRRKHRINTTSNQSTPEWAHAILEQEKWIDGFRPNISSASLYRLGQNRCIISGLLNRRLRSPRTSYAGSGPTDAQKVRKPAITRASSHENWLDDGLLALNTLNQPNSSHAQATNLALQTKCYIQYLTNQ